MADLIARQVISAVSTGTSALTLMQLVAPTNQRVKLRELSLSFAGTVATNAPILCQLMLQTTAGTSSAGTPATIDGDDAETIQTATRITFSAEPTYSTVLASFYVHPQTGIVLPLDKARPIVLKGGQRLGLVVTAANAVNAAGHLEFEE